MMTYLSILTEQTSPTPEESMDQVRFVHDYLGVSTLSVELTADRSRTQKSECCS